LKSIELTRRVDELIGKQLNSWLVIRAITNSVAECECECGNVNQVRIYDLLKNKSRKCTSCADKTRGRRTHNMSKTRLYKVWKDVKARCCNLNNSSYKDYGGRGISICNEWIVNFESFFEWSLLKGYNELLTIDRIDVNGNYEPSNCRWATRTVQNNNTRRNFYIDYQNEKYTLSLLARKFGFKPLVVYKRLQRGWSIEDALTLKSGERRNNEIIGNM